MENICNFLGKFVSKKLAELIFKIEEQLNGVYFFKKINLIFYLIRKN